MDQINQYYAKLNTKILPFHDGIINIITRYMVDQDKIHEYLVDACKVGELEVVKYLHIKGADLSANHNEPINQAIKHDHLNIVKFLHTNGVSLNSLRFEYYLMRWTEVGGNQSDMLNYLRTHVNYVEIEIPQW